MGNIGSGEVLVILVLGLLVLGPERLPEFARKIGSFLKEAKRMSRSTTNTAKDVLKQFL